jgi:hypothetical protein
VEGIACDQAKAAVLQQLTPEQQDCIDPDAVRVYACDAVVTREYMLPLHVIKYLMVLNALMFSMF